MLKHPYAGQMVMCQLKPTENNGISEAPGVITRVWELHEERAIINVSVFPDGGPEINHKTMVDLFTTEDEARAANGGACWVI